MKRTVLALMALLAVGACSQANSPAADETLAGATLGGIIGAGVSGKGDRVEGAVLGAAAGAAVGAAIGSARTCTYRNTTTGETWTAACPT